MYVYMNIYIYIYIYILTYMQIHMPFFVVGKKEQEIFLNDLVHKENCIF